MKKLLKFKVKPSLSQNMPSKKEIWNSLEEYRINNPSLLNFTVRFLDQSEKCEIIHLSTPTTLASLNDITNEVERTLNWESKMKTLVNKLNNETFTYL
ncbi:unnamed protein product [Ambrosiozyma monospora]|uniref:Unnamed protein product n=1 Tax=Ambrosiozyma monospora TaxID=43982 RepID=A0A9W6Z0X9_AMBMO|nr:unnamed protein product [Ambrosiozyma monospora]